MRELHATCNGMSLASADLLLHPLADARLWALLAWGSPDLPDPRPDPYERPVTPAALTRLAQSA